MGRCSSRMMPVALSLTVVCAWGPRPAVAGTGGTAAHLRPALSSSAGPGTPGSQVWEKRYNGPGDADDSASALAVSPDGSTVFVTGRSIGSLGSYDYAIAAYEASTGTVRWIKRYDGPGGGSDVPYALAVSPDGTTVFVTGASTASNGYYNYGTVAYRVSTGARVWVARYNGSGNTDDTATAIGLNQDGTIVFVTGRSFGSSGSYDYATVAYRASTGDRLWVRRYDGAGSGFDIATALAVSRDGSTVFVTGGSTGASGVFHYATLAYASMTGDELWIKRYNGHGTGGDLANAIAVSPDGTGLFVTGYSSGPAGDPDYVTVAYEASSGAGLWVRRFSGSANAADAATALGVSPDGDVVYVTGYSTAAGGSSRYATVAYTVSTGARLWVKFYDGPGDGNDHPYAMAVSPDGSAVFVTGYSAGSTKSLDYATVAYQAVAGTQLWVKRYNGPVKGEDIATATAVRPDGTMVFATGGSAGPTGTDDFATLAYSTS